jgi:hypothetical protein
VQLDRIEHLRRITASIRTKGNTGGARGRGGDKGDKGEHAKGRQAARGRFFGRFMRFFGEICGHVSFTPHAKNGTRKTESKKRHWAFG